MKKKEIPSLSLNKSIISKLEEQNINGGAKPTMYQRTCGSRSDGWGASCECAGRTVQKGCLAIIEPDTTNNQVLKDLIF
jgi:hypothetical protein